MLQKQQISDNKDYDLPLIYNVNGHMLHFGRRQFCLISGFKFGFLSFARFRHGDITFSDRVFPEKIGEYMKNIDLLSLIEDEPRFSSLSDLDAVRVSLLLALEVIFMGHELEAVVDDVFLRMVEDLDCWNDFAWGEHMWQELYGAIRNVIRNHGQDHKVVEKQPNFVLPLSLSGFLLPFKIWILESSCFTDPWWCKISEEIPRGCSWSKLRAFQKSENYGQLFPEVTKPRIDLYPNKFEAQTKWYQRSTEFFKLYTPRAPPVEYGGLFGDYLKKWDFIRKCREEDSRFQTSTKEVSLKDRVKAMESLCTSMMILPKEIKTLKARVYKLETIINVMTRGKKLSNMKAGKQIDIGDKYWSVEDGEFFPFNCIDDPVNDLAENLDGLVDENCGVVVERELSQVDGKALKQEAESKRLAEQGRHRFNKLKEEENMMNNGLLHKSSHMKLALQKCGGVNRRYVNVRRPPVETDEKILDVETLRLQNNLLDQFMIEKCRHLKPWGEEDLTRIFSCIDKVYCNSFVEQFLASTSWRIHKFPWCKDISVDRSFWDALICLDEGHRGWLLDEHINLWVWYMWHFRQPSHDWSIVSCYFLTLLLQGSMPLFFATDEFYPIAWTDVNQVFIPINEPKRHWSLARFDIPSGIVTFFDSETTEDIEYRPWYVKMRSCLKINLPAILHSTGVFAMKGIEPKTYRIKFIQEHNVPKQGGLFGDCGVFVCLFLYRLAHGIPLTVEDPVQMALAYREKMVKFYFQHKIICEN